MGDMSTPPTGWMIFLVGPRIGSVGIYTRFQGHFVPSMLGYHVIGIRTIIKTELRARVGCNTEASSFAVWASISAHAIPGVIKATAENTIAVSIHLEPFSFLCVWPAAGPLGVVFRLPPTAGRTPSLPDFCTQLARRVRAVPFLLPPTSFRIACCCTATRIFVFDTCNSSRTTWSTGCFAFPHRDLS